MILGLWVIFNQIRRVVELVKSGRSLIQIGDSAIHRICCVR